MPAILWPIDSVEGVILMGLFGCSQRRPLLRSVLLLGQAIVNAKVGGHSKTDLDDGKIMQSEGAR